MLDSNIITSLSEFDATINEENLFNYKYLLFDHVRVPMNGNWLGIEDCSEYHWKMLDDLGMPDGSNKYQWFRNIFGVSCTSGSFPEASSAEDFVKVIRKLFELDESKKGVHNTLKCGNPAKTKKTRDGIIIINKQKSFKITL